MHVPWTKVAIVLIIVLILMFIFFVRGKKEHLDTGSCTSEQDEINGKCYEKCREGFSAIGENCYEICKSGEKSEGRACISSNGKSRNITSYRREEIKHTTSQPDKYQFECPENYEPFSTFCVEKCKSGFSKSSLFCIGNCPAGTTDVGIKCADETKEILKESYIPKTIFSNVTDISNVMACISGYTRVDAVCIQDCGPEYDLKGALCVEKCKSNETDLGTMCLRDQTMRNKSIRPPEITNVPIKT